MKNNKGITLIALIITIIVMLILVSVTVAVVVNSDLIGTSKKATQDYKAKEEGERNIAGFNRIIDGEERYFNNVQEYIDYLNGNGATTLVAGVYVPGTTTPSYTWEQLEEAGVVHVEDGVFTMEDNALQYMVQKDLVLPEEVTTIGSPAFTDWPVNEIKSVGSSLRVVKGNAFDSNGDWTIKLPEGVTTLERQAISRFTFSLLT